MTEDFSRLLAEHGFEDVPPQYRAIYESEADQIPFPCAISVAVRTSSIHGLGVFATRHFDRGQLIAPIRRGKFRTPAGRYANHCDSPNATILKVGESVYLKASQRIDLNEEITLDYREALKG